MEPDLPTKKLHGKFWAESDGLSVEVSLGRGVQGASTRFVECSAERTNGSCMSEMHLPRITQHPA